MSKRPENDTMRFIRFWIIPLFILIALFLIVKAAKGLIIVGISVFLALALRPLVKKVNKLFDKLFDKRIDSDKKHQTVSVVLAYLIVVLIFGGIVAIVGPVVVNETAKFVDHFPETFENTFGGWEGINNFGRSIGVADLQSEINNSLSGLSKDILGMLGSNLVSSVSGVAGIIMEVVLILVLTLLILLEGPGMLDKMWKTLEKHENKKAVNVARQTIYRMANVVSTYVSRQVLVAILDGSVVAVTVFILSLILGFSSSLALPMGMITMTFYLIPMFGQFIGGTLVTVLLFFSNPIAGAVFAVIYIIYSQVENNMIAPKIQGNALRLNALIILASITIGMYMFGLIGAIVSVPIAGCIKVLVEEYPKIRALHK